MKKLSTSIVFLLICSSAFAGGYGQSTDSDAKVKQQPTPDPSLTIKENAYGPGVGMDQYGRAVKIAPAYPDNSGNYNNSYIQKPDAYGPGIHMDQYGRPVQIVPR
jgi:hypothetical protein